MINLILFTTTKGHFNNREIYKKTLLDLFTKINKNLFFKFAHIKISPGDEKFADEMQKFLHSLDFTVDKTVGSSSHNNAINHGIGYTQDIIKTFYNNKLHKNQYSLWLEDDWIFNVKKNNLEYYITYAINELINNKDLLCFRFNHEIHEINKENNINCI